MRTAIVLLSQPDRTWHWVLRLWEQGPTKPPTIYAAKARHRDALAAFTEAESESRRLIGVAA